jgi:sulfite reductase alpha subunit-like flavoprotein
MDDYDFEELPNEGNVYLVIATCGQGEYPPNCKAFMEAIMDPSLPADHLANVKFATFGLGDSSYVYFNKAAKDVDDAFTRLGAKQLTPVGYGDDKHEEKYETEYNEWMPNMCSEAGLPLPPDILLPPNYALNILETEDTSEPYIPKTF